LFGMEGFWLMIAPGYPQSRCRERQPAEKAGIQKTCGYISRIVLSCPPVPFTIAPVAHVIGLIRLFVLPNQAFNRPCVPQSVTLENLA